MHGPPLVGWLLVVLCTATGAYCLLGMRAGAAGERRAAGSDALMGLGMAAMALPAGMPAATPWGAVLFAVVFGAAGVRALITARRRGEAHQLHHAVGAFAMVYMALAMAGAPSDGRMEHTEHMEHGGAMHGPAGTPLLTGLLLVYFAVYAVRATARIVPVPAAVAAGDGSWRCGAARGPERPGRRELTTACRLSMAIGMLAMLLTL
ncbi:DUF5134 domain-containing protein [Streptomyces morookaense]|uniref:DUF5134 domain-containing protein n=1 Tax=Streptomyces morookaense TaxID=1970 RepID=UPI0033F8BABB